jgi:hypothetical protein
VDVEEVPGSAPFPFDGTSLSLGPPQVFEAEPLLQRFHA